jgi:hypothetical protein
MRVLLVMIVVMLIGLYAGAKLAGAQTPGDIRPPVVERVSYFDTATCADYLSVPINDRIHRSRELFRDALWNPGYIRIQLECAQNPTMLRRMELSIERICKGKDDFLVRNAWTSALNAHKYTCNWR